MHFGPAGRRRDLRCLLHRQATGSPTRRARLLLLLGATKEEKIAAKPLLLPRYLMEARIWGI